MKCYVCKISKPRECFQTNMSKKCFDCKTLTSKYCPGCQNYFDISEFKYKAGDRVYAYCGSCRRVRNRDYDAKRRSTEEEQIKRLENSRKRDQAEASRNWRKRNPEYLARGKEYREKNRIYLLAGKQAQRAKRYGSTGNIRIADWRFLIELMGEHCACDPSHVIDSNNKITLDHIKPLKMGGLNCIHNVQPLCTLCNMKKGISEFDFRTRRIIEALNKEYPRCEVAEGGVCCRTEFEIRAGILKGSPDWKEDS